MHPPNRRRPQHPVNRRRPRPSSTRTAAHRHSQWLLVQLRRAGVWLRALPHHLKTSLAADTPPPPADSTTFGQIPQPWDRAEPGNSFGRPVDPTGPEIVEPHRSSPDPVAMLGRHAADFGRRLIPHASQLGRQLAPRAAQLGRQLGPMAVRGATATGRGVRAAGRRLAELRPLLSLLRRFFAAVGSLTLLLGAGLGRVLASARRGLTVAVVHHRTLLFGLFTRALWWTALVLLLLGGQALVEIHGRAPLDQQALPAFAAGLAMCALLVLVAAQARLRWAALVLGFSHGGLLALVWVVAAAIH